MTLTEDWKLGSCGLDAERSLVGCPRRCGAGGNEPLLTGLASRLKENISAARDLTGDACA
eukprot:5083496-Amphidinium_carterae.1